MRISERDDTRALLGRAALRLAALGLIALGLAGVATARPSGEPRGEELRGILQSVDPASGTSLRSGMARISALGVEALPDVLGLLGSSDASDRAYREVLVGAVRSLPQSDVDRVLDSLADPGAPRAQRVGALRLLADAGSGSDLRRMVRVAGNPDGELPRELREAVGALLNADPSAYVRLWTVLGDATDSLVPAVVDGIADARDPRGLVTLGNLLNESERVSGARVLGAITTIAEPSRPPFDVRVLTDVRRLLDDAEGEVVAAAARAAGRLEDHEALPRLIELLDGRAPAAKTEALGALRFLSGLDFRADSRRWSTWYASERRWWDEEAPGVFDRLHSDELVDVVASINAIVSRRLFRNELAEELCPLLRHSDATVRGLACSALGQLGSSVALDRLVDALDDSDDGVRDTARLALHRITGLDLPPVRETWREALETI